MNLKSLNGKLEGKKKFIAGGLSTAGVVAWLFVKVWSLNDVVVADNVRLDNQQDIIKELKKLPERMKGVEERVVALNDNFRDFRSEMRLDNEKLYNAILSR